MKGFDADWLKKQGLVEQPNGNFKKGKAIPITKKRPGRKTNKALLLEMYEDKEKNTSGEVLEFSWSNKHISLNAWYSSKHWTERNSTQKEWHTFFKGFLYHPYPRFNKYRVVLKYNSRLDPSNTITMVKLCEDMLQEEGVIEDDTKEFCKGITLEYEPTMKEFTYKLTIVNIKE